MRCDDQAHAVPSTADCRSRRAAWSAGDAAEPALLRAGDGALSRSRIRLRVAPPAVAVAAHRQLQLAREIDQQIGIVKVVSKPRDAVTFELDAGERAHRGPIVMLIPVYEQPALAMPARFYPR